MNSKTCHLENVTNCDIFFHLLFRKQPKMSSLYPSLEDMQVHKMVQAQESALMQQMQSSQSTILPPYTQNPYPQMNVMPSAPSMDSQSQKDTQGVLYPGLGDFMGLELSEQVIALNMPEYLSSSNSSVGN